MGKIRFATAILEFSKKKGGAETYLVDLCARMAREGYEVHVYTEHWEDEPAEVHLHRIKTIPFPKSFRLLSFAIRATKEIEKGDYDVSLGIGHTLKADILQPRGGVHWAWFWRSLRAYDHPMLWAIKLLGRIFSPKQWMSGWIEGAAYRKKPLCCIIAISDMIKQDMIRWYGIQEGKITVVYNGVDIELFHPRNQQYREEIRRRHGIQDEFLILFVSNNFRMKGLGHLIRALANIKEEGFPPFKCLVIGRGRKHFYIRLAKKLGVSKEIVFAGSTVEPEKYYGAADLLVHPTFYDACSRTVLEAMASGLPVITTTSNGASGILTNGQEGYVIEDPRSIEILSKRISSFFEEEKRKEASSRSRRCVEYHSFDKVYEEMKDIFKRCIKEKGRGQ